MARPQTHNSWDNRQVDGIDIMMAMDVSTSMLAEDLKPNRLEAAKNVASEFIADRPNDNIGLTIFAGEAFTQCPMTTDHASLKFIIPEPPVLLVVMFLAHYSTHQWQFSICQSIGAIPCSSKKLFALLKCLHPKSRGMQTMDLDAEL
jgi:hypothetical protein